MTIPSTSDEYYGQRVKLSWPAAKHSIRQWISCCTISKHLIISCIVLTACLLGLQHVSAAERELEFDIQPNTFIEFNYQGEKIVITETLHIRHKGPITNAMLTFSAGQSGDYENRQAVNAQGKALSYQIYKDLTSKHVLKDVDARESHVDDFLRNSLNYTFPTSVHEWQYYTFTYTIEIPGGQLHESGVYSDTFNISLYERRNLNNLLNIEVYDIQHVSFNSQMDGLIQIAIVSPGSPADFTSPGHSIYFGTLEPGLKKQAELIVVSNTSYSLFVESPNQGVLTHDYREIKAVIPYSMSFDANPVAIQSPDQPIPLLHNAPPTGIQGIRYPLEITISQFSPGPSGTYRDYPTFFIQAK